MIKILRFAFRGVFSVSIILFFLIETSLAGIASRYPETVTRHKFSLSGNWSFRGKESDRWQTMKIPGSVSESATYFFKRNFRLPASYQNKSYSLLVDGVNFRASVSINNHYVGDVPAGFEPLEFQLDPEVLHDRRNFIQLEVDASQNFDYSLPLKGGLLEPRIPRGITGEIALYAQPAVSLKNTEVAYRVRENNRIALTLSGEIGGTDSAASNSKLIAIRVTSPDGVVVYEGNLRVSGKRFRKTIQLLNGNLWQPDHPVLYEIEISLKTETGTILDVWKSRTGFRQLERRNGHFYLNGNRLKLKGLSVFPGRLPPGDFGRAVKRLGANAVLFIYPPRPELFQIADSLGFFILTGPPLWNTPAANWKNPSFRENVCQFWSTICQMGEGHPSFFSTTLGVGNDGLSKEFFQALRRDSLTRGTHFFSGASFRTGKIRVKHFPLDWVGFDLTTFRHPKWKKVVSDFRKKHPETPILFTQVSAPFVNLFDAPENELSYEKRQGFYLWKMLRDMYKSPDVAGCFVFTNLDYPGSYPSFLNPYDRNRSEFHFGLQTQINDPPRIAWKMVHDLYQGKQINYADYVEKRDPREVSFILWGFGVIIFFLYFLRGNRHVSGNFVRVFMRPKGFYEELQSGRKIAWGHSLVISISGSATLAIFAASLFFYYRESLLFDYFMSQLLYFHWLKQFFVPLVWNPSVFVLVLTAIFFFLFSLLAVVIRVSTIVAARSLSLRNALTMIFWLSGVFIFLIPFAMISARIWLYPVIRYFIFLTLLVLFLWFIYRIFRGMVVILHFSAVKTALSMIAFIGGIFALFAWFYQMHSNFWPFLSYVVHVWTTGI